jgi:2-phosphosulfolactate phosphatase
MTRSVVIDCFPSSVSRYSDGHAVVAVDVIRATTMAITGVALGRRCFVADTPEAARAIAARLAQPLLAGELGGDMPAGFDMNNSPAQLAERDDLHRPMVMLSSSGTQLMCNAARCAPVAYLACLRNFTAVAQHLAENHERVAVIGAGSRNEFREEDEMCCAWVAESLMQCGYTAGSASTVEVVRRWTGVPAEACTTSNSVSYLRRTNQLNDLDFILAHIDDLNASYTLRENEVVSVVEESAAIAA